MLLAALDGVACAVHAAGQGAPAAGEQGPPPPAAYRKRYATVGQRFPGLGYYQTLPSAPADLSPPLTGDAIDDIVDIARDMRDALWRLEHLGREEALRHLQQTRAHWSSHLRELARHLEARATR